MSVFRQQYDMLKAKAEKGAILSVKELNALKKLETDLQDELGGRVFTTIEEVEEYTGYKKTTIYDAVGTGVLLQQPDKSFLQTDVDVWLRAKGKKPKQMRLTDLTEKGDEIDGAKEEARYRKHRAEREKLLVEKLRGEMLPRVEVEQGWAARAVEFSKALLMFNRAVSHELARITGLPTTEIDAVMDANARKVLASITRPLEIADD